jgi:hypothetical protein
LRNLLREHVTHDRIERNHQGLGNMLIELSNDDSVPTGRVLRPTRIGSVLKFYYRAAA